MTKLSVPTPGQPVRGSRSGAPIMALFDLLGRRWAMGILWTLCKDGPLTFRALMERCETVSPTVLNSRLKELQAARFIEKSPKGYVPTELGRSIYRGLVPLAAKAKAWAAAVGGTEG